MAAENKSAVGLIVISFVAILIGVIGVAIISDGIVGVTDRTLATESLDLSPAIVNYTWADYDHVSLGSHSLRSGFRTDYSECEVTALTTIKNYSGTAMTTPLLYNFTKASGTTAAYIQIPTNGTAGNWTNPTSNTTTVTYWYCGDNYIGGWAGTVTDLVPGFFAIGIMIIAALIILWIMKKENIDVGF